MSSSRAKYLRALGDVDAVITALPDDAWAAPTICRPWNVRHLVGHLIDGQEQVLAMLRGRIRPPHNDLRALAAIGGRDPRATWAQVLDETADALSACRDLDVVATPRGPATVDELLATAVIEPLVHAWDLASAVGRTVRLDPEVVSCVLDGIAGLGDALAATGMYAPATPTHDGMNEQARLLALTGRTPEEHGTG